jgi:hypothetical protein
MSVLSNAQKWLVENAYLLADRFGDSQIIVDSDDWQYLLIKTFYLPVGWYPDRSRLLLCFPSINNILTIPPEHFYLDPGLRTYAGAKPPHYYEGNGFNDLADEGFARFSFHIEQGWQPRFPAQYGTTLVDLLSWLDQGLTTAIQEAQS